MSSKPKLVQKQADGIRYSAMTKKNKNTENKPKKEKKLKAHYEGPKLTERN